MPTALDVDVESVLADMADDLADEDHIFCPQCHPDIKLGQEVPGFCGESEVFNGSVGMFLGQEGVCPACVDICRRNLGHCPKCGF